MDLQHILSRVRKVVDTYGLIEENDKIALGISGGKDSLAMLIALREMQRFYPKKYDIIPININLNFENINYGKLTDFCDNLGTPIHILDTQIAEIVFKVRKESNPCALCAKMRKGAINSLAKDLGCNKIAYAHNLDDFIETGLMGLIYEGRFHVFKPKIYLDRMDLTVIRPMIYIDEYDLLSFAKSSNLPIIKNPCPADGNSKREYVKNLIKEISKTAPKFRDSLFSACKDYCKEGEISRSI